MSTSTSNRVCRNRNLNNFSSDKNLDSPATGNYWDISKPYTATSPSDIGLPLKSEVIKDMVLDIKRKFHVDRQLLVKHLPKNVVEDEIASLLADFKIKRINLFNSDDTSSTATVTLENPESLDEWDDQRTFLLRGQSVSVLPTTTDLMLCVARMPLSYTEEDFYGLISVYGEVKTFFLMISEKTGNSKGYGFVRYVKKESALIARNCLNDKVIDTFQIVCDWLNSSHSTFSSLHSKCLYVDKLPRSFKDMCEFRDIFSTVVRPPYCQIALKNGCLQDWGLVEYLTSDDAELAQSSLNGFCYKHRNIRVLYYIPGVRAINLYLQLLNEEKHSQGKLTGLLPEPSGQSVMMSIQNLSKQNPVFAHNLRNIIINQIQESKISKESVDDTKLANENLNKINNSLHLKPGLIKQAGITQLPAASVIINNVPGQHVVTTTFNSFIQPPPAVPVLPNTSVPPPMVDTLSVSSIQPVPALEMHNRPQYIDPQMYWNNMFGNMLTNRPFTSFVTPPAFAESSGTGILLPPPLISSNYLQQIADFPPNMQQNVMNIINSSPIQQGLPATANLIPVSATQPGILPYPSLDSPYIFAAPSVLQPPMYNALPMMDTKSFISGTWAPFPQIIPHTVPTLLSNGEWSGRVTSPSIISQPSTPLLQQGQKRKLLPSPESSPEGNYIGQHSQGIGGHYADSYFKRRRQQ